jgi:cobalamin biosynthesis Mg chelatase CobN
MVPKQVPMAKVAAAKGDDALEQFRQSIPSRVDFAELVIAFQKGNGFLKFTAEQIQSLGETIKNVLGERRAAFAQTIGNLPFVELTYMADVLSGKQSNPTTLVKLTPYADIVAAEVQRRVNKAASDQAAQEAAAAAAAKKAADDKAAADAAAAQQATSTQQALTVQTGSDTGAGSTALTTTTDDLKLVVKPEESKSSTMPILLGLVAVLGVVYFVSKRQQSLSAAPMLLEDFDY